MAKVKKSQGVVSKLRFPEFEGGVPVIALAELADLVTEKIGIDQMPIGCYVSTENLLPDFAGLSPATKRPSISIVTRFLPRDVLISNIRPYLKKVWQSHMHGGASNDVLVVRALDCIRPDYLGAILRSDLFIDYVMRGSKGVKMPRGEISMIKEFPVPFPRTGEQQKIADCLSSLDACISGESRKFDALKAHKQSLMQQLLPAEGQLLPQLRFPGFEGDWKMKEVGDVFSVTRGEVLPMSLVRGIKSFDRPYPVYSSQTKANGLAGYYSDYLYEDAITWTTDGANAGDVNYRSGKFYCTNVCGVLISSEGFANPCLAALIGNVAKKHVSYVGNPKLMNGVMAKILISIPSRQEQNKIADFLSALENLIAHQSREIVALQQHKKGLMQGLFPVMEASAQ